MFMRKRALLLVFLFVFINSADAAGFQKNYALVIGIDKYKYASSSWKTDLNEVKNNAERMADYLESQHFEVRTLLNEKATKVNIISKMRDFSVPKVGNDDQILFFFAGHSYNDKLNGREEGYIVPYDGGNSSDSYISIEELSEEMGMAKHQLFIIDACLSMSEKVRKSVAPSTSGLSKQVITAGCIPGGYTPFSNYMLQALQDGLADNNGDGSIAPTEICNYLFTKISTIGQPPVYSVLSGHKQGEFIFNQRTKSPPDFNYPTFPWPPPQASAQTEIPSKFFRKFKDKVYLHDVKWIISNTLNSCMYYEKSYHAIIDGFALVTRIEQINENGTSKKKPDERWGLKTKKLSEFTLHNYIKALFTPNIGYYRVIVFIVTPHAFSQINKSVSRDQALSWLNSGSTNLPALIGNLEFTEEYVCTALVYEFEHLDVEKEAIIKRPGRLPAITHLEESGIWDSLEP